MVHLPYQLVQDFFHQQYDPFRRVCVEPLAAPWEEPRFYCRRSWMQASFPINVPPLLSFAISYRPSREKKRVWLPLPPELSWNWCVQKAKKKRDALLEKKGDGFSLLETLEFLVGATKNGPLFSHFIDPIVGEPAWKQSRHGNPNGFPHMAHLQLILAYRTMVVHK